MQMESPCLGDNAEVDSSLVKAATETSLNSVARYATSPIQARSRKLRLGPVDGSNFNSGSSKT